MTTSPRESLPADPPVMTWTIKELTFRSDETTARLLISALQTTADALLAPTEVNASALFLLGAGAVRRMAEIERASA